MPGYGQKFTGVILAGGASRRMGRDKALLCIGGLTMLEHMRLLLRLAGASRVVVLGRNDVEDAIPDARPLQGPAIAVQDYLMAQPLGSRHLVVPVDMPGLTVDLLSKLARQTKWAHFRHFQLPFLAVADGMPSTHCMRIGELLVEKSAAAITATDHPAKSFTNVNEPGDLENFITEEMLDGKYVTQWNPRPVAL